MFASPRRTTLLAFASPTGFAVGYAQFIPAAPSSNTWKEKTSPTANLEHFDDVVLRNCILRSMEMGKRNRTGRSRSE